MSRKEIQVTRMLEFFIDATAQIIKEEGIESVTARKVADLAGYTSSTIYNYFDELSHLVFFASLRFLKDYIKELSVYIDNANGPIDKYLSTWECFCKHSFNNPQIFYTIFISNLGTEPNDLLKRYYTVYKSDLIQLPAEIKMLVLENDLSKRSKAMIQKAIDSGELTSRNIEMISEMTILLWKGMLTTILNNRLSYSPEKATEVTMGYIRELIQNYTSNKK
ncbi:TetR/AcrR family transcriptional regulator [Bacillus sp. FJAT-29790]|uniref:TetR/AcrR family transcriptional regulator n=1 Tax=Bacillus sp. FJAT-29790 TaxID=1895002 RepID=UPI0020B3E3FB|nr:TetR/AcrR family transcriptional regulator [Bacillus sp. FJAT-29790]